MEKFNPENFGYQIANEYDDCNVYNRLEVINGKERNTDAGFNSYIKSFQKK